MEGFGGADFAHPDNHHFGETTLHGTGEAGVKFDAIENKHSGGFVAVSIHPDVPRVDGTNLDALHTGADFHSRGLGGETERFDHLLLAFGRGSVVGAHGGDEKRFGPVLPKPIPSRFGDGH